MDKFLGYLVAKSWIFVSELASRIHVLQPLRMEMMRDLYSLYSLNLLVKVVLLCQILFNLAIASVAEAVLMPIFAKQVPFLDRVAPKYLKLITSSNFWLFMLISTLISLVLLIMILFFFPV